MPYTTVVAGTTITAAWGNANVRDQGVTPHASAAARTSAVTSPVEGMLHHLNDVNTFTVYSGSTWSSIGPVHGGLTTWTPVIVQGATPTLTVTYAVYSRVGRRVTFEAVVTTTSAGTAANDVTISLPVAMNNATATNIGTGTIQDVSASLQYDGFLVATSSTVAKIRAATTVINAYLGSTGFTAALASGDFIKVCGSYEAAADA